MLQTGLLDNVFLKYSMYKEFPGSFCSILLTTLHCFFVLECILLNHIQLHVFVC